MALPGFLLRPPELLSVIGVLEECPDDSPLLPSVFPLNQDFTLSQSSPLSAHTGRTLPFLHQRGRTSPSPCRRESCSLQPANSISCPTPALLGSGEVEAGWDRALETSLGPWGAGQGSCHCGVSHPSLSPWLSRSRERSEDTLLGPRKEGPLGAMGRKLILAFSVWPHLLSSLLPPSLSCFTLQRRCGQQSPHTLPQHRGPVGLGAGCSLGCPQDAMEEKPGNVIYHPLQSSPQAQALYL